MKKLLPLLLIFPLFVSCGGDDEDQNEFYQKQVTNTELESETATYKQVKGSSTYYLVFENGTLRTWVHKGGKFTDNRYYDKYEIKGDSLYLTKKPYMEEILGGETEYYTLYINIVHWGYDKTTETGTGGDQLLIRGDNVPYMFETGYYDKSSTSLKL